jgi:hypothetical protein
MHVHEAPPLILRRSVAGVDGRSSRRVSPDGRVAREVAGAQCVGSFGQQAQHLVSRRHAPNVTRVVA